jgi:chromate transporter
VNDAPEDHPAAGRSAWRVFWVLLRLGAVAFGGLGAALALLDRDLVARRGWLTSQDVRDALTYTKPLPGSTVVQVVTFLGWRLGKIPGALAATVGFLLPSVAMMTAAAAGVAALPDTAWVHGGLLGLQIAVVGLLAHAMAGLLVKEARTAGLAAVAAAAAIAGFWINAALVVAAAGLLGVAVECRPRRNRRKDRQP